MNTKRAVILAAVIAEMSVLATAAQASGKSPGFPHEAAEAGRWSLLIAVAALVLGLPIALFVVGLLSRGLGYLRSLLSRPRRTSGSPAVKFVGILRGAVVGADGRVSTSKTVAVVWTYTVASALLAIVVAKWVGHGHAYGVQVKNGLQGEYALLIGGPVGAAILAKGIVSSQIEGGASRPSASSATTSQLVTNDQGETDLGDLQYVLFNTVALIFFLGDFLASPQRGLPTIPDVLLGLTSVSAVGYVAKKALPSTALAITKIYPDTAKAGDVVKLYVSGLADDQGKVPLPADVLVTVGPQSGPPQSSASTSVGPVLDVQVSDVLKPNQAYDVTVKYESQTDTETKGLKVVS